MPNGDPQPVNKVAIHMYRMGTGDCFVLKFMKDNVVTFKMLIDCGCWSGTYAKIRPFIETLKKDVENEVDVLVVTHEHKDHVYGFAAGKELLTTGFKAKRIWMGWTEQDGRTEVETWKTKYGEKKRALGMAARTLKRRVKTRTFERQFLGSRGDQKILEHRQNFADVLEDFAALHLEGDYKGSLKGMAVVKDDLAEPGRANVEYFEPGQTIEDRAGLEGVRIFVLGPPLTHDFVKKEHGEEGESFEHNDELEDSDLFVHAMNATTSSDLGTELVPFSDAHAEDYARVRRSRRIKKLYVRDDWRRIDDDWLFSAGQFALRMSGLTNNLSLVLAFEFQDSGKVVLFPGDAEFGSWESWHKIDWEPKVPGLTTEKLLNRVVFYKVAHHLSHNGTAQSLGLDMMTHPELAAMATLDYDVISSSWKSTMPNRMIMKELLERTKGRTMVMSTDDMFYDLHDQVPLTDKITEFREKMSPEEQAAFDLAFDDTHEHYTEYVLEL